ncbi:MAG: hypothetical protein ACYCDI_06665 [Corynebacterium aurimucosum]|uniref:hypothetical protein n=1 Tax=Corynebacterium sp. HMSC062A03 TaxID=1739285 RepID=UPI000A715D06|nr:hypothetical protein [Corynebacterium sp. HMSC062A03]
MPGLRALSLRIPRAIGFGAGLLALALFGFSAAGAAWGLWRPALKGHRVDDGGYALSNVADVQFDSYITFVLITGVLSAALGATAYVRGERYRGVGVLLWVALAALAGAASFYVFGGATATYIPENPGEYVEFVPKFSPGSAWLVGPFMAMFAYWSALFIDSPCDAVSERDSEGNEVPVDGALGPRDGGGAYRLP